MALTDRDIERIESQLRRLHECLQGEVGEPGLVAAVAQMAKDLYGDEKQEKKGLLVRMEKSEARATYHKGFTAGIAAVIASAGGFVGALLEWWIHKKP
jgi:hypothetical protein